MYGLVSSGKSFKIIAGLLHMIAREYTNILVTDWIGAVELGAGEILLTSVDMEGTQKGFDLNLIDECSKK